MTINRNLSKLAEGANSSGVLAVTNGGTGITSLTAGYIPYGNGTSAFSSSSGLQFDGTNLGLGVTPNTWSLGKAMQIGTAGDASILGFGNGAYLSANAYYNSGWKYTANNYAVQYLQQNGQHIWQTAASGTAGNAITFTQAMTLDANGKLLVGWTTAPTASASVIANGIQCTNTSGGGGFLNLGTSGGGQQFYTHTGVSGSETYTERMRISAAGGLSVGTTADPGAGAIYATGNITAYYSSDRTLKENIQDVPNALSIVSAIGSKTFDWTDAYIASKGGEDGYFVQKSDFGVVAQDVQSVFPQAVRTRQDGTLAVDYEKLATLAFGAIKELAKRVEALEAK